VEINDPRTVTFHFKASDNRELPLIIGQLPVLPKHHWQDREFDKDGMLPPLGSGPYRLAEAKPGKKVVYQRRKDYWAQSLPVMKGRNNFDRIILITIWMKPRLWKPSKVVATTGAMKTIPNSGPQRIGARPSKAARLLLMKSATETPGAHRPSSSICARNYSRMKS
jgi:MarR-like DNA-binding transcriptional regulator SgrR of sgrS sRNA